MSLVTTPMLELAGRARGTARRSASSCPVPTGPPTPTRRVATQLAKSLPSSRGVGERAQLEQWASSVLGQRPRSPPRPPVRRAARARRRARASQPTARRRVERQQLDGSGRDGRGVVVERRPSAASAGLEPAAPRRPTPSATGRGVRRCARGSAASSGVVGPQPCAGAQQRAPSGVRRRAAAALGVPGGAPRRRAPASAVDRRRAAHRARGERRLAERDACAAGASQERGAPPSRVSPRATAASSPPSARSRPTAYGVRESVEQQERQARHQNRE